MREMAALSASHLPADKPHYLMGVGTPADLLAAIGMGYDMFDCVLPTRNARNGRAFTSAGRVSIKRAEYARDQRRWMRCDCRPCRTLSRAYLRHLYMSGEILAARALTEHNLYFYRRLMREAQAAIASGTFKSFANARLRGSARTKFKNPTGRKMIDRCSRELHGRKVSPRRHRDPRRQVYSERRHPVAMRSIFYFLIIRPQTQKASEHTKMLGP